LASTASIQEVAEMLVASTTTVSCLISTILVSSERWALDWSLTVGAFQMRLVPERLQGWLAKLELGKKSLHWRSSCC
jgi:hypothetical protein